MDFDDLDKLMRSHEQGDDRVIAPGTHLIARLDGRGFTMLTKTTCNFEAPFDVRFRDMMVETVRHIMTECGFKIVYGYTESDEISLLFHPDDQSFGHKARKLLSVLAGETSAAFSLKLGMPAAFDCRLCEFVDEWQVIDYFRWRQEDSRRNALNAHCYWLLRKQGRKAREATAMVSGKSIEAKKEMLRQNGIDFNALPTWQRNGIGLKRASVERKGYNPVLKREEVTRRNVLQADYELPSGDDYSRYISQMLQASHRA